MKSVSNLDPSASGRPRIESGTRLWGSRFVTGRAFGIALVCLALSGSIHCGAQDKGIGARDTEAVVGQRANAKPRTEGFNPMHDRYWLAGYRESFTSAIPEELRNVDALTRARRLERLVACADAWFYPFSERVANGAGSGIDLDIARAIASRQGWRLEVVWDNTESFAGNRREFGRGIDKGHCDIFTGVVITGDDNQDDRIEKQIEKHKLTFTGPYLGLGFVLVLQPSAVHVKTLDEIKREKIRIGVQTISPMEEYIRVAAIDHELYYRNERLIDGLLNEEVRAAMLWTGALATLKRDRQTEFNMVPGYVPAKGQRWNGAWAIQKTEPELKRFLEEQFEALLKDGEIKRIVERYGVPFYPPFDQ